MLKQLCACAVLAFTVNFTVGAKETADTEKLDKALEKFTRTGETKNCINPRRIRDTKIVDENYIIFRVAGKTSYLNSLPRRCRTLDFYQAIIYRVRGSSLCSNDIFQVFDRSGITGGSCSFGKFEKLAKKAPEEQKTENSP